MQHYIIFKYLLTYETDYYSSVWDYAEMYKQLNMLWSNILTKIKQEKNFISYSLESSLNFHN